MNRKQEIFTAKAQKAQRKSQEISAIFASLRLKFWFWLVQFRRKELIMFWGTADYLVQQERYADLLREAEQARLVKAFERNQERRATERWYNRYLFPLFFAIGLSVTNR